MSIVSPPQFPDLIAHRGNAAEYPENTLPALRSALDLGIRHIMVDVQFSADRQPVLLHDSDLLRTAGIDRPVLEMNARDLSEVSVNEDRRFKGRFTDVGIPTLAQAVSLLESHPAVTAFVQLKRASLRAFGHEFVARRVCEVLKPIARQCVLISADFATVHHLRQVAPIRTGWVLPDYSSISSLKCEAMAPDYLFCDGQLLTDNTSRLWRGPWRWAITEVNSRRQAMDLARRGARFVQTTHVRDMLREFRSLQARVG